MASRKIQTDIDRCLKEVVKGCDLFDEIHHKLLNADTQAKKDKSEDELKTQIKKLQRVRDQLKTWLTTEEIREKDPLVNARKNIESRMELFKKAEKESKTKAFSKEGLSQAEKLDPEMQAVIDCMNWVNDSLNEIRSQKELAGADLETIQSDSASARGKSKKSAQLKEEMENLQDRLKNHQFHVHNLELILRGLDNGMIAANDVNELRDTIEDYVQNNNEPDHMFDDMVYAELELDSKLGVIGKEVDAAGSLAPAAVNSLDSQSSSASQKKGGKQKSEPSMSEVEEKALELKNKQDAQLKKEQERQRLINVREETKKKREMEKRRDEELLGQQPPALPTEPAVSAAAVVAAANAAVMALQQQEQYLLQVQQLLQQQQAAAAAAAPVQMATPPPMMMSPMPETPALPTTQQQPPMAIPPLWPTALDVQQKLFFLEASLNYLPRFVDSERSKMYIPHNVLPSPIREFPQVSRLETRAVFEKMDLESILFIFYHQPGTFQQFLAAKELKRQDWRFHKLLQVWMQRYEDPTQATSEYEMGNFVYFDPVLWEQRVKVNFTVEYKHLEL